MKYSNKKGVSVVICCYNSSKRLPDTLEYLSNQKVRNGLMWEILIVDNNSDDNTSIIAQKVWNSQKKNVPFRVVSEPDSGLSHARKKGVENARYEYIIFCDDDNWLASDYVENAFNIINSKPDYAAIGGQSEAVFDKDAIVPVWFDKFKRDYAVGKQGEKSSDITHTELVWGAGIVIKRSVFLKVYKYPPLLSDRKGKQLHSGGDNEMCLRFILFGFKLYYDDSLKFWHYIPKNRLEESYHSSLKAGFIEASDIVDYYHDFLKLYVRNRNKLFTKLKWELKYWLYIFKIQKIDPNSKIFPKMVNLFTPHFKDRYYEFNEIKKIYKSNKVFKLIKINDKNQKKIISHEATLTGAPMVLKLKETLRQFGKK